MSTYRFYKRHEEDKSSPSKVEARIEVSLRARTEEGMIERDENNRRQAEILASWLYRFLPRGVPADLVEYLLLLLHPHHEK